MDNNEFFQGKSYQRCIQVLTSLWLLFICFGSWYPLDIRVVTLKDAVFQWAGSWNMQNEMSDKVINFALGIPTGLLFCEFISQAAWFKREHRRMLCILEAVLWLFCCSLIAFAVEIGQVFFSSRFSSLQDSLLQIAGSVLGGATYFFLGSMIRKAYSSTLNSLMQLGNKPKTAIALFFTYFFVQLFPFIPGISPSEIKYKLQEIRNGFTSDYTSFPVLGFLSMWLGLLYVFLSGLTWFVIGLFLQDIRRNKGASKFLLITLSVTAITITETLKILVDGRFPSATNWSFSVLGLSIGLFLSVRYADWFR